MAKGTRRSSLFKISKREKKKMVLEKKKLALRRAKKRQERLEARRRKAIERIAKE